MSIFFQICDFNIFSYSSFFFFLILNSVFCAIDMILMKPVDHFFFMDHTFLPCFFKHIKIFHVVHLINELSAVFVGLIL